ncbi:MAG: Rieske (2Fe-2S) protein [Thaumarchaeota archaeon]|nr:Rieske (2Fe-2S) protein [Nitrososphaerota archaeon]
MNRREFIRGMVVTSALVATGAVSVVEFLARAGSGDQTYQLPTTQSQSVSQSSSRTQTQQQTSAPPGYVLIGPSSALNGRTSAYFTHPAYGDSILVNVNGTWRAFSSTCTHAPCTVQYGGGSSIYCPCHGATFSPSDGTVLGGPAPAPLPEYGVQLLGGNLYVTASVIN